MSVSLNPSSSLSFKRPLTTLVKRSLTITNNNAQPVAFKVKTTAPKLYCVRPNSGRVEPGESVDVSVMLQALKEEPPLHIKCKDKFLIQSTIITPEKETMSLQDIWASSDANEEGKVHQQKLRVTYLPAEGQIEEEDEQVLQNVNSVLNRSDSQYDTVRQQPQANGLPIPQYSQQFIQRSVTPPVDTSAAQDVSHDMTQETFPDARSQSPSPPAADPVSDSEPLPVPAPVFVPLAPVPEPAPATVIIRTENPINEELQAKLDDAQAEISRLKAALTAASTAPPTELRRRRAPSEVGSLAETDVQTVMMDDASSYQQEGVPLQVVVIIALGVFITTYLFF